jgi:hypothetical protein
MTLRHEPDVSVADWVVRADAAWTVLATQGPPGFEAYATVRFDAEEADPYRPDPDLVALVTRLAADHTRTPDRCWFALWEGWGELEGSGRVYAEMDPHRLFGRLFRPPRPTQVAPAFDRSVLDAPRADLAGDRAYLLFSGSAADVGDWGARPPRPGWPADLPQASFTWPQDRAWCLASDVDPDWFTVGGSRALVEAVLARPDLRAEPATYGSPPHG